MFRKHTLFGDGWMEHVLAVGGARLIHVRHTALVVVRGLHGMLFVLLLALGVIVALRWMQEGGLKIGK